MKKDHSKIVCIKLVHLPYLFKTNILLYIEVHYLVYKIQRYFII